MMMWDGSGVGWGWGMLMMVVMVAFWGGGIWAIVYAVTRVGRGSQAPHVPYRGPEQILSERFAAGEIDEQEYRTRLAALRDQPPKAA